MTIPLQYLKQNQPLYHLTSDYIYTVVKNGKILKMNIRTRNSNIETYMERDINIPLQLLKEYQSLHHLTTDYIYIVVKNGKILKMNIRKRKSNIETDTVDIETDINIPLQLLKENQSLYHTTKSHTITVIKNKNHLNITLRDKTDKTDKTEKR